MGAQVKLKQIIGTSTGSVVFIGAGGILSEDNSNLFWDNTNNRLGIGTATPSSTLDIVGTLQYVDGNQASGKVLTSDASGNAIWQTPSGGVLTEWEESGQNFRPITPSILDFHYPSDTPADGTIFRAYNNGVATGWIWDNNQVTWLEEISNNSTGWSNWSDFLLQAFVFNGTWDYTVSVDVPNFIATFDLNSNMNSSSIELVLPAPELYTLNGLPFGSTGLNTGIIENADLGTLPYHKIRALHVKTPVNGTNFSNTDLTFTGDRIHDLNNYNLSIIGYGSISLGNGLTGVIDIGNSTAAAIAIGDGSTDNITIGTSCSGFIQIGNGAGNIEIGQNGTSGINIGTGNLDIINIGINASANIQIGVGATAGVTILGQDLRITTGSPGAGKVLTSDASGNATWEVKKAVITFTPGTAGVPNTITHSLGTADIIVQLWDVDTGAVILADINNATSTQVDITFTSNPTGDVKAVIM